MAALVAAALSTPASASQQPKPSRKNTTKSAAAPAPVLPAGEGRDLVARECARCHALAEVIKHRESNAAWKRYVDDMVVRGATLKPQDIPRVVDYLARNFAPPPGTPPAPVLVQSAGPPLAEGEGKQILLDKCTVCHDLERVPARYRDKVGWEDIVDNMRSRGAEITDEERQKLVDYLTAHYGIP